MITASIPANMWRTFARPWLEERGVVFDDQNHTTEGLTAELMAELRTTMRETLAGCLVTARSPDASPKDRLDAVRLIIEWGNP